MLGRDPNKLISYIYMYLLTPAATATANQLKTEWESDLGAVSGEDWEEALTNCKTVSPKLSDRLTHLYILHRSYLTPCRIQKYRPEPDPKCPSCSHPDASFYHLLWTCRLYRDSGLKWSSSNMTEWAPRYPYAPANVCWDSSHSLKVRSTSIPFYRKHCSLPDYR